MTPSRSISPFSPVNRQPQEVVTLPAAAPVALPKDAPKPAEIWKPEKANGSGPESLEAKTTATVLTMPAAPKESVKKAVHDPFWLGTRLLELKKLTAGQLETAIAVSYTHLDVYKRQQLHWNERSDVLDDLEGNASRYAHLGDASCDHLWQDVYKRQS